MKVLVCRFSSIGDIVLTTPVLRAIRQQTGAEVHALVKRNYAEALSGNPYLSAIHTFDRKLSEVLPELRRQGFGHVVDLHGNLRSSLLRMALGRPASVFPKLNMRKYLYTRFGVNTLPAVHIVERYMQAAAPLGARYDGQGLDFFIPPEQELPAHTLPPSPYVAVALGAAHATKRMPLPLLRSVIALLPCPVVLLGGPAEGADGERLAAFFPGKAFNYCGALRLGGSASVLRQAAAVLTPDTGLMHIAAALRRPIVSVWGNTVPAFGMTPLYPDGFSPRAVVCEVAGLRCRPCSKIGHPACPKGHFDCMGRQDPAAIARALTSLLDG